MWLRTVTSAIPSRAAATFAGVPAASSSSTSLLPRREHAVDELGRSAVLLGRRQHVHVLAAADDRRHRHPPAPVCGADRDVARRAGAALACVPEAGAARVAEERVVLVDGAEQLPAGLAERVVRADPGQRLGRRVPRAHPHLPVEREQRVTAPVLLRHPDDRAPGRGRRHPGKTLIEIDQVIGTCRSRFGVIRSMISSRLSPVAVMPWFRRPTIAREGSGAASMMSETARASSAVPHG